MLIRLKKCLCLKATMRIDRCIYTASLYDSLQIEISLTVPDQIYFLGDQFLLIWACFGGVRRRAQI